MFKKLNKLFTNKIWEILVIETELYYIKNSRNFLLEFKKDYKVIFSLKKDN